MMRNVGFWVFVASLLALAVHDVARTKRCPCCARGYAIWPIRGRLGRWVGVCSRCHEIHHARQERMR